MMGPADERRLIGERAALITIVQDAVNKMLGPRDPNCDSQYDDMKNWAIAAQTFLDHLERT